MKRAVLHICNYAAAYRGNFVESLQRLETALEEKGVTQVYLFPHRAHHTLAKDWIAQMRAEGRQVYWQERFLFGTLRVLHTIRKQYDVQTVVRHFMDNGMDFLVPIVFGKRRVIRFFHSMYGDAVRLLRHRWRRWLYRRDVLVGVSEAVSEELRAAFPKATVTTVTNAVCFDRLDGIPPFAERTGLSCMVMGYNSRVKGVDLALAAVNALRDRYPLTLYIVAASHVEELKTAIRQQLGDIPDWVQILPPREDVAAYYKGVDFFLAPSRFEGFSYAVVEASYCETAVVFSDIAAHRLLRVDPCYRFESENIQAFTEMLERAIAENSDMAVQRSTFRQRVTEVYSIERWVNEVCALIEKQ